MANPCLLHLPLRNDLVGRDRNGVVTATASGPVRFTSDGFYAEEGTTNGVPDPSFENTTITTYWGLSGVTLTRDTAFALLGGASAKIVTDNAASVEGMGLNGPSGPPASVGQTWTASLWVYGTGSLTLFVRERDTSGNLLASSVGVNFTASGTWTRITHTHTIGNAGTTKVSLSVVTQTQQAATFWIDGAQLEQKAYATSYCDGSLGTGYTWAGTAHASASSRAGSQVSFPASYAFAGTQGTLAARFRAITPNTWGPGGSGFFQLIGHSTYTEFEVEGNRANGAFGFRWDGAISPTSYPVGMTDPNYDEHVFLVDWVPNQQRVYVDNDLKETFTLAGIPPSTGTIRTPGRTPSTDDSIIVRDLMIFDRPLTDAERARLASLDDWSFDVLQPKFGGVLRIGTGIGLAISSVAAPAAVAVARTLGGL